MEKSTDNTDKSILVIGAGGIGCEIMKNLVMLGCKKISIIDLDVVEKSNLNRQFLFDNNCIGRPKALMLKEAIEKYCSDRDLKLSAYYADVKDTHLFPIEFFRQFDILVNALDNISARLYINKISYLLSIPLVNSGTEGYLGFVGCYDRTKDTPCYACTDKPRKKTIPVCSIRSKPQSIEHCVIWAKNVYEIFFCSRVSDGYLDNEEISLMSIPINDQEIIKQIEIILNTNNEDTIKSTENSNTLFQNIKKIDISDQNISNKNIIQELNSLNKINQFETFKVNSLYDYFKRELINFDHISSFSLDLYKYIMIQSCISIVSILNNANKDTLINCKFPKFDKNLAVSIDFIFSLSNLRAISFGINTESRFNIKSIAGNIIPAIASTNAIMSGLQAIEIHKIFNKIESKNISFNIDKRISSILSHKDFKNDDCVVCGQKNFIANLFINDQVDSCFEIFKHLEKELNIIIGEAYIGKSLLFSADDDTDISINSKNIKLYTIKDLIKREGNQLKVCDNLCDNLRIFTFFINFISTNDSLEDVRFETFIEQDKNSSDNDQLINQDQCNNKEEKFLGRKRSIKK